MRNDFNLACTCNYLGQSPISISYFLRAARTKCDELSTAVFPIQKKEKYKMHVDSVYTLLVKVNMKNIKRKIRKNFTTPSLDFHFSHQVIRRAIASHLCLFYQSSPIFYLDVWLQTRTE